MPAMMFAVFLAACSSSTSTPAVDAKQLQQRLDQFVTAVTQAQPDSEVTAKAEGTAKVETASDGTVTGTLPRMTFASKEGNTTVLDPISVSFANGGDGQIKVEAKMPPVLSIKDKSGKVAGEVRIGSQTLKAIWVDKLQTLDEVDMRLANLTITSTTEPGTGKVGEIAMTGKLEPKGGGAYDGKYAVTVSGFEVSDTVAKTLTKMDSLSFASTIQGAKLEAWATAAKEAGYTLANPELFKAWTGGQLDPKMIAFLKRMPEFMGSMKYTYGVNGISVQEDGKLTFAIKNTSMGFGVSPDGQGTTKVHMVLGIGGVSTGVNEPLLPPEADVENAAVEIEATGVPGQKLWDIYMDALPKLQAEATKMAAQSASGSESVAAASSTALEEVGSEVSGKFLEVMTAAKLSIAINQLNLVTPTAKVAGKGTASYFAAVSMLPEGKISLRFTGIDALAKAMEKRGAKDETAQQIMGIAAAVRAMGKPDPTSTPADRAYIIDIVFTKDGKVLANGQNLLGG